MRINRRSFIYGAAASVANCKCCVSVAWAQEPSEKKFKVCTEIVMADIDTAYAIAIDENPLNDPEKRGSPRTEAISLYSKRWNPSRRILDVDFLNEPKYIDKVKRSAKKWEEYIGIRLRFGKSNPDILVDFAEGGSWSYIGTDSKYFASRGQVSMNFGWFDEQTDSDEFDRTTIHEFGHALSLVHEHSHPDSSISWNREKVYDYYAKDGWSKADVDEQIFAKYSLSQVNGSKYDRLSIMHYSIPLELVTNPNDSVGWNTVLSDLDKITIAGIYPKLNSFIPSGDK